MWGGPGSGAGCLVCNNDIRSEEMGLELEYDGSGQEAARVLSCHVACLPILKAEWEAAGSTMAPNRVHRFARDQSPPPSYERSKG